MGEKISTGLSLRAGAATLAEQGLLRGTLAVGRNLVVSSVKARVIQAVADIADPSHHLGRLLNLVVGAKGSRRGSATRTIQSKPVAGRGGGGSHIRPYNIAPHGQQPSPRPGFQSHHPESQTDLLRALGSLYKVNRDWTLLLHTQEHYRTFGPQRAAMGRPGYESRFGTPEALEEAVGIMQKAGVPPLVNPGQSPAIDIRWETALKHAGYLFETTPLRLTSRILSEGE